MIGQAAGEGNNFLLVALKYEWGEQAEEVKVANDVGLVGGPSTLSELAQGLWLWLGCQLEVCTSNRHCWRPTKFHKGRRYPSVEDRLRWR